MPDIPTETAESSDSLFESGNVSAGVPRWADIRLLHASRRGWCDVYMALRGGRRVALKVLAARYRGSEIHRRLLRKEYDMAAGVSHPYFVEVYGFEPVPELGDAIVMEYADGPTLGQYLADNPRPDAPAAERIAGQICSAVDYLHCRGRVHADLKPSNILLTHDGQFVKLLDFGLSRGGGFELLDIPGGTEGFSAPEVMQPGGDVTPRADVYSIGCLLKLMASHGGLRHFRAVAKKCMAADPQERPPRASLVQRMLARRRAAGMWLRCAAVVAAAAVVLGAVFLYRGRTGAPTLADSPAHGLPVPADSTVVATIAADSAPLPPVMSDAPVPLMAAPVPGDASEAGGVAATVALPVAAADSTMLFDEQLYRYARQCAAVRFKEHLHMIDTMTTNRSNQLTVVGHWRWKAREDVRRWLESRLSPGNPRIESLMKDVASAVEAYGKEYAQVAAENEHRAAAIRRDRRFMGAQMQTTIPLGNGAVRRKTLLEDGTYLIEEYYE